MSLDPLFLVGFRMSPDFPDPDFYAINTTINGDVPLMYDVQLILIRRPEDVAGAVRLAIADPAAEVAEIPEKRRPVIDLAQAFYVLAHEDHDPNADLVNAINILFDMVKAIKAGVPPKYRQDLSKIADHLTFSKDVGALFQGDGALVRTDAVEAMQWMLGAMFSRSMFFPRATGPVIPVKNLP